MSYTRTIPQKPAALPSARPWAPRRQNGKAFDAEKYDPTLHNAKVAFFFLLLFTAVLFGRPGDFFWDLRHIPIAQIVAISTLAAYAFSKLQGRAPFVWSPELKLVFALTIFYTLGLPFAFWKKMTFDTLTEDWMKTVIIFFLITQTMFTMDRVRKLLWVIFLCEFVVAGYSLIDTRRFVDTAQDRLRGSTVGFLSGNYLGIAAATTLPYIALLLVRSRSFLRSVVLVSTFGLLMLMVVRTASRGSMVSVIAALVMVWVVVLRDSMKARLMGFLFLFAIFAAVAVAPEVFWERVGTMWDSSSYAASDTARSAGQSEMQRKALARRSIEYTLENPIFGLGLGNFAIKSGSEYGAQSWKGTHNTYLQVAAESGIPAFLMFLALLYVTVRNMHRIGKISGDDPATVELRQMARATAVSLYAFMISALFAHLAYYFYLYYLIGISVALQSVYNRKLKARAIELAGAGGVDTGRDAGPAGGINGLRNGRRPLPR